MTDYYSLFSFMIETKDEEELAWLEKTATALELAFAQEKDVDLPDELTSVLTDYADPNGLPVEDIYPPAWEIDKGRGLWMHNDESCGQEFVVIIAQAYLRKFKPAGTLGFEIAHACSKARLDGFGGSAAFITKDEIRWGGTYRWLAEQAEQVEPYIDPARTYSLSELEAMPTLEESQFDDLKMQNSRYRLWLSRMTVFNGQPYDNQVTVEKLEDGGWKTVRQYRAGDE